MRAIFDHSSPHWMPDNEYNILFVRTNEKYLNELLKTRGYVTIFEVYSQLGLELDLDRLCEVRDTSKLMWRYDKNDVIDFRMAPIENQNIIVLDFNIDID